MTVEELRNWLAGFRPDAEVLLVDPDTSWYMRLRVVPDTGPHGEPMVTADYGVYPYLDDAGHPRGHPETP